MAMGNNFTEIIASKYIVIFSLVMVILRGKNTPVMPFDKQIKSVSYLYDPWQTFSDCNKIPV
jgi:hypothetical protein